MMLRKTVKYGTVLAYAVLAVAGLATAADDKKDDKPALKGVWALKDSELKLEFSDKDVLKISPHGKDEVFLVVCKYTLEKEGLVKAKITGLEGKAKVAIPLLEALATDADEDIRRQALFVLERIKSRFGWQAGGNE